jgi:putative ABC transport system ATP-binding protein
MSRDQRARIRNDRIGFVFQSFNLLARTPAIENVELPLLYAKHLPARERHRRAKDLLERVGLADRLDHTTSQLSGGQQQRVAIARALVNEPDILMADEPTGNLDTKTASEVMDLFQILNDGGITVLIVTHEPVVADHAERIIELRDGSLLRDERVERRTRASGMFADSAADANNGGNSP